MEYLDIVDEQGQPTGKIISRTLAHTEGIRHRTVHIWIVRRENEHLQVLMQKRAMNKDSFPGKYDTSSAGSRKNLPGQRNCLCLCLSAACRYRDTRPAKRGGGIGAVV